MTLDQSTQTGEAHNARIVFKGVPILYTPYLSFPLDDSRKSGLLPPTVSVTSHNGVEYLQPYYLNLAPNYDLTLYPKVISARGLQVGGDARYVSPSLSSDTRAEGSGRRSTRPGARALFAVDDRVASTFRPDHRLRERGESLRRRLLRRLLAHHRAVLAARAAAAKPPCRTTGATGCVTAHELRYQTLQDPASPISPPYREIAGDRCCMPRDWTCSAAST